MASITTTEPIQEIVHKPITKEMRESIEHLMGLIDTYADTSVVNGIRSGWAKMARASVQSALLARVAESGKP